ncbi:MAG: pilus assembly PilX N-terminal domain-containing protein [Pseudomonadota bacterium]|nr:pilus assembly PilX N-terminal domain-containing protein [Pseudomonadota bacterium]
MIKIAKDCKGMALVICLLIMTVAAMMGIGIATTSTIDGQISRNQRTATKDFFIADGTNQLETPRIITDNNFAISDITKPLVLQLGSTENDVLGIPSTMPSPPKYLARTSYHFYRATIKAGYSLGMFNSYFYTTRTIPSRKQQKKPGVKTFVSQLGPKI